MSYTVNLYTLDEQTHTPTRLNYPNNAEAGKEYKRLTDLGRPCYLTHVFQDGREELYMSSKAPESINQELRWLFWIDFFLVNWTDQQKLDWLRNRIIKRAEKYMPTEEIFEKDVAA